MSMHAGPLRRMASGVGIILFVALALACAGRLTKPKNVGTVKVNEDLVFDDSKWTVVEVRDLGRSLKPTAPDAQPKQTDGRYLVVRFKVANTGRKAIFLGPDPTLLDDQQREFETLGDQKDYLAAGVMTLSEDDSDQIPAGMTREFQALYEIPANARGLRLRGESFTEKRGRLLEGFIDLGR